MRCVFCSESKEHRWRPMLLKLIHLLLTHIVLYWLTTTTAPNLFAFYCAHIYSTAHAHFIAFSRFCCAFCFCARKLFSHNHFLTRPPITTCVNFIFISIVNKSNTRERAVKTSPINKQQKKREKSKQTHGMWHWKRKASTKRHFWLRLLCRHFLFIQIEQIDSNNNRRTFGFDLSSFHLFTIRLTASVASGVICTIYKNSRSTKWIKSDRWNVWSAVSTHCEV